MDQIVIKTVLIIAFVLFGLVLMRPSGSARNQAVRTITLVLLLAAAVVAVVFPNIVNDLAVMVGVGRGTDLVLYALILVFVAQSLTITRKRRQQDAQTTELARKIALMAPEYPEK